MIKKKTNLMIIFLIFVILAPFSFGAVNDAIAYYSMDNDDNFHEGGTPRVLDISGSEERALVNSSAEPGQSAVKVLNEAFKFTSASSQYMYNDSLTTVVGAGDDFAVGMWVRLNDLGNTHYFFSTNTNYFNIDYNDYVGSKFSCTINEVGGPPTSLSDNIAEAIDTWYYLVCGKNSSHCYFYIDGVLQDRTACGNFDADISHFYIGKSGTQTKYANGYIDEVGVYTHDLTISDDIPTLYNAGTGYNPYGIPPPSPAFINVTIGSPNPGQVFNELDLESLDTPHNISLKVNVNDTDTTCTVNDTDWSFKRLYDGSLHIPPDPLYYWEFMNNTFLAEGTYNLNGTCVNTSDSTKNDSAVITFHIDLFNLAGVNYSNNISYGTDYYVRDLNYNVWFNCRSEQSTNLILLVNGTEKSRADIICTGDYQNYSGTYTNDREGDFNIQFRLNDSSHDEKISNTTFRSDLYSPNITYANITTAGGFYGSSVNFSLTCTDLLPTINYTVNHDNSFLFDYYYNSGTANVNQTIVEPGVISARFTCGDLFGNTSTVLYNHVYSKQIIIIDETTGGPFDLNNVSNLTVFYDDNSSFYSFKDEGSTSVYFTSTENTKLRVEIKYVDNTVVMRYIDISIDPDEDDLRICANTDEVTHYEQIITGSSERAVTVKSVYANCVIAQDYLRFVYENNLVLKAYTKNTLYYLYTYDDNGNKVYLSSMDGSFSTYYNVDVLEFNKQGYNIAISGKTIGVDKYANETLRVYFQNLDNDSVSTILTITQVNNSNIIFSATDTDQPNDFYMLFDYSTLDLDENTLFKAEVETTTATGETVTIDKYFTLAGKSGLINSGFAFVLALFLTIFGLTFTIVRITFGWFGILVQLGSIAILSMAVGTTYTLFLQAINVIILVYIVILLSQKNYSVVA